MNQGLPSADGWEGESSSEQIAIYIGGPLLHPYVAVSMTHLNVISSRQSIIYLNFILTMSLLDFRTQMNNNVLRKTEVEFVRIEKEYEEIIKELEATLSSKLLELKKETEEHKVLHDEFESMCSRSRLNEIPYFDINPYCFDW